MDIDGPKGIIAQTSDIGGQRALSNERTRVNV
jgi:hypothetical protein